MSRSIKHPKDEPSLNWITVILTYWPKIHRNQLPAMANLDTN